MIKKILFATDLGAFTSHSLMHVEMLARHCDAQVHVVHAVPNLAGLAEGVRKRKYTEASPIPASECMLDVLQERIFDILLKETLGENGLTAYLGDVSVQPGPPATVILQEAERYNVDLIVIGSHGPAATHGCILGSVAAKVLQLSRIPVFMVPMMHPALACNTQSWAAESSIFRT